MVSQQNRYLQTPDALTEHVLERGGCPLHYWLGGDESRALVVLTHGATMDHRMFNAQVEALLPEYRVLVWDVRGHGRSQPLNGGFRLEDCADDLIAILDQIGVEAAVLGGQSMGGYITQYAYLRHPGRVRAIVIIGATCIALPYSRWEILLLKSTLPMFNLWPYEHFARTVARTTALDPAVQDYAHDAVRQINHRDFLAIWKAVTLAIDEKGLPGHHIRVPLLLTHGEHDGAGTIRRDAPKWAAYEPDVRYEVVPKAAHNANQDNPDFFNRVLLGFLQERVPSV